MDIHFKTQIDMLNSEMEKWGDDGLKMMNESVVLACNPILKEMKNKCPVDTGALKASLGIQNKKRQVVLGVREGVFDAKSKITTRTKNREQRIRKAKVPSVYGPIVDKIRPWFTPIWEKKETTIEKDIADSMSEAVKTTVKKIQRRMALAERKKSQ